MAGNTRSGEAWEFAMARAFGEISSEGIVHTKRLFKMKENFDRRGSSERNLLTKAANRAVVELGHLDKRIQSTRSVSLVSPQSGKTGDPADIREYPPTPGHTISS